MSLKEILKIQHKGIDTLGSVGVIGYHLVSGPLVGFCIGYFLDDFFSSSPVCILIFFLIGIGAGFLNVYRDTKRLLAKIDKENVVNSEKIKN